MRTLGIGLVAALLAAGACGDDESGETMAPSTSTGDPASTGGSASDDTTSTGPMTGSTAGSTGLDESSGGGSSTGAGSGDIVLQNDGWEDPAQVAFQEGFAQDECWASVYVPEAEHYPFVVDGVSAFIGGDDMGFAEFGVELWDVDDANTPTSMIASGTTMFAGENMGFDGITMQALGIDSPVYAEGNFAIAVCLLAHEGFPSIGRDADGTIAQDLNWIRLADGSWIQSSTAGLAGDWIMRATIVVQ